MTNKEAIFKLIEYRRRLERDFEGTDYTLDAEPFDMAIEALTRNQWTPCSERPPEEPGRYLCTVGSNYRNPREMCYDPNEWLRPSNSNTWKTEDERYYCFNHFVKAWMPLPEPWKGEEE